MPDSFLHGVEVITIDDGVRTISVPSTSVIGVVGTAPRADVAAFPLNTPVVVNSRTVAAKLLLNAGADDGTLPDALDSIFDQAAAVVVVVRVEKGVDDAATTVNVVGGVDSVTGQHEGVHALLAAESITGSKPRILIAPGFTHQQADDLVNVGEKLANPVVTELIGIADRLRAVVIADGLGTTNTAAIAGAEAYGSKRLYVVEPGVLKVNAAGLTVASPASPCVAGVIARVDAETGFWASPSNQIINGIIGTSRAIDFNLGDATNSANLLNEKHITTIVRQNGYRVWGNHTLSADAKWKFLPIVRTADIIADALQMAHLWAVDRGITKTYVEDVREGVNAFLRQLKAEGAILGGECWLDPDLNNAASVQAGHVYWDFDFSGVYPAERLTFRSHLVDDYIKEIF